MNTDELIKKTEGLLLFQNINKSKENTVNELIENGSFSSSLDKYTKLKLNDFNLTSLKGIDRFVNLKFLECNNNKLTSLKGIKNLKNLKVLNCKNNKLTSLEEIKNLKNLEYLYCSNNKIISLKGFNKKLLLNTMITGENIKKYISKDLCYDLFNNVLVIVYRKSKEVIFENYKYNLNDFLVKLTQYKGLIDDFNKIVIKKGKRKVKLL